MPGKSLTTTLQGLLATAAKTTPRITGESARAEARYRPNGPQVILCDVSGSMIQTAGARSRIEHLREALGQVVQPTHTLLAFASSVTPMQSVADLPSPSGGTALDLGLRAAGRVDPASTLVISDGEPTDERGALAAADAMTGRIDVIYCGDEINAAAIDFMRRLCRVGGGRVVVHRWGQQQHTPIASTMRLLLAGPGRPGGGS